MMRKRKGYPVYPLTAAQKFHFFYYDFCPKKEVLNIGTSLTIETEIDWEVLKQSIYKAYDRQRVCVFGLQKIKKVPGTNMWLLRKKEISSLWIFQTGPWKRRKARCRSGHRCRLSVRILQ